MKTITIWSGHKSFVGDNNYETVSFSGSEIGAVRFEDADSDIQYRVFRDENGNIIIFFVERRGYECTAEVFEYKSLEEAAKEYRYILRKAGVI